jgi:hypothetical protein
MLRDRWHFLLLLLALFALWAFFALAPGCDRPRPTKLTPAERTP